jgi:trehalose 6-phosphate phosphatase
MKDLLSAEQASVLTRLAASRTLLAFDFDGTLAPIVPHPDDAALDPTTREALRGLAARCRIAIVSGRERTDVERRVAIEGLWYAGSHGFDIRGPAGETFTPPAAGGPALDELDQAESRLRRELGELPGIVIERKRFGLTAHYRMSPVPVAERALQLVRSIARESPHLAAHPGERVIELRPDVRWDKGRAVDHLLEVWRPGDAFIPIYLGDGLTDEDAFGALAGRGLSVLVGAPLRPTRAQLRLADPAEVGVFLAELRAWLDQADGRAV